MGAYIVRRIVASALLALAVTSVVFLALHAVPGDPAEVLLAAGGVAPPAEAVQALRVELGLDKPILTQYLGFLGDVLTGNLGTSFTDGSPVAETIATRLPRTLELIAAATVIALLAGVPLGVAAATNQGGPVDRTLAVVASLALSVPVFVLGTGFIYLFASVLDLVPAGGYVAFSADPVQHVVLLLMPASAIAVGFAAVVLRMTRASVIAVLNRDWVRTARAKGLPEGKILSRHVVRNAIAPVVTVVGLQMGSLLGGSVLVEYVFNWPGLSGYLVTAIENRDYPEVRGTVLVVATLFILLNLVVDLINMALDPKVRHG